MSKTYETAVAIHQLYLENKKQSLGSGFSIVDSEGKLGNLTLDHSEVSLTPQDAQKSEVIKEFLNFNKKKRSSGKSLGSITLSDGRVVNVFMMTLIADEDYLKCQHLFRCHALLQIKSPTGEITYYDSGAHRKFYNMDTPSNPQTMSSTILEQQDQITSVELHEKVSGSQILCLVAPKELQNYFLFQFFSKRGSNNVYSDLGAKAFEAYVSKSDRTMKDFYQTLLKKGVTSMTFEVMGVDRHVSMDQDCGSLILHGVSLDNGQKMSMSELETFAIDMGLEAVKVIFRSSEKDSFAKALEAYRKYDYQGNTNEGGVMTINFTDHQLKLKCKTWWYLYLRDLREAIPKGSPKAELIPTLDSQMGRMKMFGAPEKDHLELSQKFVLWWLWVRSNQVSNDHLKLLEEGDHPVVIDHFLSLEKYSDYRQYHQLYLELIKYHRNAPVIIPLAINVGLMGTGKSSTGKQLGVTLSQDQCGGRRPNLVKEAVKYLSTGDPSQKFLILDRTNLTAELRSSLLWDISRELAKAPFQKNVLLVPFFLCHTIKGMLPGQLPPCLVERVLKHRVEKESHESLTLEGNGTLSFLEILRRASYQLEFPNNPVEALKLDIEDSIQEKVTQVHQWIGKQFPDLLERIKTVSKTFKSGSYTNTVKTKLSYAGYGTPHHNLVSNPNLKTYFGDFLRNNPDATEHNSHVTIVYGADHINLDDWTEGKKKVLSWIGTFEQKNQVCGSIVLDCDPSEYSSQNPETTKVYHVTGWTAKGVAPFQSNTVLNAVTNSLTDKPILSDLLSLFGDQKEWVGVKEDWPRLTSDQITLRLFDQPLPLVGYEGTYQRK